MSGCSDIIPGWGGKQADNNGFSLTELIVVMGIFLTVMLITSSTFKIIANSTSQQSKSAETQIEGVVGLEVLRADLEQAGFGLPWSYLSTLGAYQESVMHSTMPKAGYWPSGDPSTFNDSATQPPRPILSANTNFNIDSGNGAKYIAIKSMTAATNGTAKKWTNVSYTGGARTSKTWGDSSRDFAVNDWVVAIKNNLMTAPPSRQLKLSPAGNYYVQLTASANLLNYTSLMSGHADGDTYQVYGVAPGTATPRMPFNRADYYVLTPATKMPEGCAPHTGVLYKANITHATSSGSGGGGYAPIAPGMPLLDCVADMQIVYGLDTDGGGRVNSHIDTNDPTADLQRSQ